MGEAARTLDAVYTYGDYAKWPEGERWELIDGRAWAMSPAPTVVHQRVISRMYSQLAAFLEGHQCEVLFSPVDVLLPEGDERVNDVRTVVQPDIVVVCDPDKIKDNRFIRGTPDLVVEVLSPSTAKKDMNDKFNRYQRAGLREYWVVDPRAKWLQRYLLGADGTFGEPMLAESIGGAVYLTRAGDIGSRGDPCDRAPSAIFEGFAFDLAKVFAD